MTTKSKIFAMILGSVALLMAGCAAKQMKQTGFLQDYSVLEPGPKDGVQFRYLKPGVDFKNYDKLMIDNVQFFFTDEAGYQGIDPVELKELADAFHEEVIKAIGDSYPMVDSPGPDVMRIRTAITNLEASSQAMSAISTVLPIGLGVSFVKKAATGEHTGVGRAGMEVEFLDSLTNERIGAAVDERAGGKLSGWSKWGGAHEAFQFWAKRLRTWLDEVHEKQQKN